MVFAASRLFWSSWHTAKSWGEGFGFIAVNSFFVLSGFLITALLVNEWQASQTLSFRHFYLRRALRLLPALTAMLAVFMVVEFFTAPHARVVREFYEALRAMLYFSNWSKIYHIGRNVSLAHTWSLSIEEQFYLIWPILLLFLLRRNSPESLLCWLLLGIFLTVGLRIALLVVTGTENVGGNILSINPDRLNLGLDTRADSLLFGCCGGIAVSFGLLANWRKFCRGLQMAAILSVIGLAYLGSCWAMSPMMISLGWLFASLFAVLTILYLTGAGRGFLLRVFEHPILVRPGKLSYGLYVWHYPVLVFLKQHNLPWKNLAYLIAVVPIVMISYYGVEKPFLNLKKRFAA